MKRASKFLAFLLACLMVFAMFGTALADDREIVNGTYVTGTEIAAEPITLKVAVKRMTGDQSSSYAVKPFVKKLVEETGLNIEWIEITTDPQEQTAVLLASGKDIPDVFLGLVEDDILAKNRALFADLTELLPTYAPHVVEFYNENNMDWDALKDVDGGIYHLYTGMYTNEQNLLGNMPWINITWLKNVGMEMPTTTDELYEVLKAFKEQDANGNGDPDDEIPLAFAQNCWGAGIGMWAFPWGVQGVDGDTFYTIRDGKVVATVNTDMYREYLEFFHKCYTEGLIDNEGFSETEDQYVANLKSDKAGMFYKWSPQNVFGMTEEVFNYDSLGKITVPGHEDAYLLAGGNEISASTLFAISANCEHKEAALRMWDYLSATEEMRWLTARGPEDMFWEYGEDGVTHYNVSHTPEELQALVEKYGLEKDFNGTMTSASFYMDTSFPSIYKNTSYPIPGEGEIPVQGHSRALYIRANREFIAQGMSKTAVPDAINEELTFACEGLEDFIKEFRSSSIINGVTDESWNKYVKELEDYNYDFYLKYYQMKLDGNFEE